MRRLPSALAILSLTFTFAAAGYGAENWPQFRGPDGQGHSAAASLPDEWSDTKNVRWKVEIPGRGWSSPIVWGRHTYLTTAVSRGNGDEGDQTLTALCLDAATGRTVWSTDVFEQTAGSAAQIHSKNSHASPTPVTDGRHVWVHFGTQGTACLTMDGKIVWRNRRLAYDPRHGSGGSPVLVDGRLIVNCDGADVQFVAALDQRTGEIVWKRRRPQVANPKGFSFSTPLPIEINGQTQVVSPGTDQVVAYDPETGRELWTVGFDGYSVIPRPVFAGGLIYISTSYNDAQLLAIDPAGGGGAAEPRVEWQSRRNAPHTPSALAAGDELYFVSDRGVAACVDARTGTLHWQQRLGGNFSASPLYGEEKIYFQSEEGVGTVIRPDTEYAELARNDVGERTLASYAIVDSDLLIRGERHLFRIGRQALP